jgi:hypothetical protein
MKKFTSLVRQMQFERTKKVIDKRFWEEKMKHTYSLRHGMLLMLAVFGLLTISSTANAQYGGYYGNDRGYYGNDNRSVQIAINNGYQLGYGQGSNDRAYGRRYDVDDSKTFRDADSGYRNSGFRDKDQYKRLFRQGFEIGYRDGYSGNRRRGYYDGGYSNRYPDDYRRDRGYGRRNGRDRRNGYDPYYDPRYRY